MDGAAISDARQDFGQFKNSPEISMRMNADGAKTWKRLTGENVGHAIAIVLDDMVYSYPNVMGEIPNAKSFASLISKLPVIEELPFGISPITFG